MNHFDFTLFHYWRSSTSWRVRFAFELKGIQYHTVPVNLLKREHETAEHLSRHPFGAVPVLEVRNAGEKEILFRMTQSLAIIQWLDQTFLDRAPLLPGTILEKARIWELVETINSDTHPLQNVNVQARYSDDPEKRKEWAHHWNYEGLQAFETLLRDFNGPWCMGNTITLADICLLPQVYNALRFDVDISAFPKINSIWKSSKTNPAFIASHPDHWCS